MHSVPQADGLQYRTYRYGEHSLQRLGIWSSPSRQAQTSGYWIVFIHGGAWRDPRRTLDDFLPSIEHMSSTEIKGFISIDYRLSPHPDFPQDPAVTPVAELRNAKHPQPIQDIASALAYLCAHHQLDEKYILVGHSAGATLAFQLLMDKSSPRPPLPAAIVGISGIYDLVGIDARHDGQYAGFISGAFGEDRDVWISASPAHFNGDFREMWPNGQYTLLAWSPQDSLIDEPEIDSMAIRLRLHGVGVDVAKDLTGEHDSVWEEGSQVSRLVSMALAKLRSTEKPLSE